MKIQILKYKKDQSIPKQANTLRIKGWNSRLQNPRSKFNYNAGS